MNEIQLEIEKVPIVQVQGLLIDYFGKERSPLPSVFVKFDVTYRRLDKDTVETTFHHFQIAKEVERTEEGSRSLATITIQDHPECVAIFIKGEKDKSNEWENVKKLVKEIIWKAEVLKFKFILVKPRDLLPESLLPKRKIVADHFSDRAIVKLWYEGYSCPEIASKVFLQPRTINNIICILREKYGPDTVPYDKYRSKKL